MKAVFALLVMAVVLLSGSTLVVESRQIIHEHTTTAPRDDIEVIVPPAASNINNASGLDQLLGSDTEDMHVMAPEMPTNMKVCTNAGICYMKKLVCPHMCGGGLLQKKHVVQGTGSCIFDCHKCIAHC
ncbi:hypothetical protein QJS10_CPB11g02386 [Acorus calamus]|uniref:Uncharacterized protein n=1 Tax=Acorus calamus TaxID=4465 RepID=A0AAV9DTX6_ACOCL|nr:hypothetical protein QJS10_CPB11g02386 [Acorus calamus]